MSTYPKPETCPLIYLNNVSITLSKIIVRDLLVASIHKRNKKNLKVN